jgi:outer membrane receptor protein involved in Fe transport
VAWLSRILFALAAPLLAGGETGEVRLRVSDESGAAMRSSGSLQNTASGVRQAFRTDAAGGHVFTGLPLGPYKLEVSQPGFIAQTRSFTVSSPTPVVQTIELHIGSAGFAVEVVGITPLAGVDLPVDQVPSPVQSLTGKDIAASGALDLSQLMYRRMANVAINETQGNPFQPDVNYRGYTASPVLGTPEGVSVYMDGVRLNQPFGDIVSWDLIPKIAIAEVALIPGSNPLFGLNTLGGALSLQTKDGAAKPGTTVQVSGGSFGRRAVEFDHGWANSRGLNWYVAGNLFHEDGWRQASPSDVKQGFSKLGWQGARSSVSLTGSYADNTLNGNALQDQRFIAQDYTSVYTLTDTTWNRAPFLNLSLRHTPSTKVTLSGNVYFRYIRADTISGDVNENSLDQAVYQPGAADIAALRAAGYSGFPLNGANAANTPFPKWRCIAQTLQGDEPGEKCNAQQNRTYTKQHNYGFSGQLTGFSLHNQLTAGFAYDRSSIGFQQTAELGYFNPDHTITTVGAMEDGTHAGNINGEPLDTRVSLRGAVHTSSGFATDTISPGRGWTVTLSGRFNRTIVGNTDRILPGGGPGSLDGHNIFQRFNPAIGFTWIANALVNVYGSYSEGSRAPTSIELGCADPAQPCKLPNALAGDPPLKQVVTRTFEAGLRGNSENKLAWNAGFFRAHNDDDILFVSSTATGFGYFRNFGQTQRQGLELGLRRRFGRFTPGGNYTFLDATYQSPETIGGSSNSTSNAAAKGLSGSIAIQPGNRIPLIPQHLLKAFLDWQVSRQLSVDLDFHAVSSAYARGNENNLQRPDGVYYLGPGSSPGYGVLNLGARWQIVRRLQLFVQMNNLLDQHYFSAAQLGPAAFTANGNFIARQFPAIGGEYPIQRVAFYAPGAPFGAQGGIRLTF